MRMIAKVVHLTLILFFLTSRQVRARVGNPRVHNNAVAVVAACIDEFG